MAELFIPPDDPDALVEALVTALRKASPSKAVCAVVADMLDSTGWSEFKLVVKRRRPGKPGQLDDAWFAKYRRAEKIFSASPDKRTGIGRVRKALFVSDPTARKYWDAWEAQQKLFWDEQS